MSNIIGIMITDENQVKLEKLVTLEFGSYSSLNRDKWMNKFLDNIHLVEEYVKSLEVVA